MDLPLYSSIQIVVNSNNNITAMLSLRFSVTMGRGFGMDMGGRKYVYREGEGFRVRTGFIPTPKIRSLLRAGDNQYVIYLYLPLLIGPV